ncbi:hypothetical protein DFJ73DRAFT_545069 [Zopfochytrium polystomum]|nr:hypothetical protein DFJ73DRAFT_545069 [Zopfochytrium polystomum]
MTLFWLGAVNAPATGTPSVATAENASTAGSALTQSVPILITPQPGGPGTPLPQRLGQVAGTRPIIKTREEREMHRLQQLQQQQQQQQQHPNSQQGFVLPSTVQFRAAGGGIRPVNQGGVSMFAGSNVQSGPQNQFKVPSLGQQSHQVGHPQQSLPNLQQQQQQSPQASQQQQFNIVANRGRGRINPVQRPMAGRIGVDASGHSAGMRGGGMIRGTGGQGRGGIAIVGSRMSGNGGVGVLSGGGAVGNGGAPTGPGIADPSSGGVGGSSGGVGSGGQPRPNVGGNAPQG